MEEDIENMIRAAEMLGFKAIDGNKNKYECTKDQIVALCAIVANAAIEQVKANGSD